MIFAGIFMTGALPRRALVQVDRFGFSKVYSRTIGRLMCASGSRNQLALGLLMGFLPCGLLYAALLVSLVVISINLYFSTDYILNAVGHTWLAWMLLLGPGVFYIAFVLYLMLSVKSKF